MIFDRLSRRIAVAGALVALAASPALSQREPQTSTQNPGPLPGPMQPPVQPQQQPLPGPAPQGAPAPQPMGGDQMLVRRMSIDDIARIARELGYSGIQQRSNNSMTYQAYGHTLVCYVERDGDLRLVYAVRKRGISVQRMNDWNRDRRLSRAFIDKEGDPVLETDLLSDASMTPAQVRATFKTFETSVNVFRKYIGMN